MADSPSPRSPETSASQSTRQLLDELDALMQRMLAVPVQPVEGEPISDTPAPAALADSPAPEVPVAQPPVLPPRHVELFPAPFAPVTVQAPVAHLPSEEVASPLLIASGPSDPFFEEPGEANLDAKQAPAQAQSEGADESPARAFPAFGTSPLMPILLQRPKALVGAAVPVPRLQPLAPPRKAAPEPVSKPAPQPAAPARPAWMNPSTNKPAHPLPEPGWIGQMLVAVNRTYDRNTAWLGVPGRWLRSEQGRAILGWSGLAMLVAAVVWAAVLFLG